VIRSGARYDRASREEPLDQDRFSWKVLGIVAKRAANICSNPDCQAVTAGPADDPGKAIIVGEAAHIYGAKVGSARYKSDMGQGQRGDVTNAIWLCCTCHKIIDSDAAQFPAELLFEWKRDHDRGSRKSSGRRAVYCARGRSPGLWSHSRTPATSPSRSSSIRRIIGNTN
jgi:hypothetical protein